MPKSNPFRVLIDPFRTLLRRRNAKRMLEQSAFVTLLTTYEESLRGNFVYPGIDTIAQIHIDGKHAGDISYCVNPLGDRLYVKVIEIRAGYRFRGVGLATLWRLWEMHRLPIVPMPQRDESLPFWNKARKRFANADAIIEAALRTSDLEQAKQRWAFMVPVLPLERHTHQLITLRDRPYIKSEIFDVHHSSNPR